MTQSLVIDILELLMDHAYLSIRNTESLSVDKTLDSGHLIQKNDIVVLQLKIDGIEVAMKKLVLKLVDASLSESQVEDATEYFEKILGEIFAGWMPISVSLLVTFYLNFKFVILLAHHVGHYAWCSEYLSRSS